MAAADSGIGGSDFPLRPGLADELELLVELIASEMHEAYSACMAPSAAILATLSEEGRNSCKQPGQVVQGRGLPPQNSLE